MRKVLLFLLFASWLSACNHRHKEFPSLFWDSIALHDSVLLPDSLLDKGLQQAIEADDSLHISLIYFFKGKKLHQDFFLLRAQECYEKARQYLPTPSPSRLQMELDIAQADFCRFNHFASQETRLLNKALDKATCKEEAHHCGCQGNCSAPTLPTLDFKRASSEFEALRLATEKASHQPVVFMLTIGNLAMRLARSQFATNFFGCAGYKIIDNLGFDTVEAGIDAALEAKADIVVLCSSDDEYATLAPEAFKYLNGRALFVVAGAPACTEELNAIGITEFIHVRSNVLDTLKSFNAKLSI